MTIPLQAGAPRGGALASEIRQLAVQLLCLLVVISLLLLSFGPMLDHHFAERHPGHQHIYLGSASADHSHTFERFHGHDSAELLRLLMQPTHDYSANGIVIITPTDGTGPGPVEVAVPLALHALPFSVDDGTGLVKPSPEASYALSGTNVFPPKRPPRA